MPSSPPGASQQFGGPGKTSTAGYEVSSITITDLIDQSFFTCHAMPRISYGKTVNWTPHDIQGRSLPIFGFQSSSSTAFNLTIPLHGQIEVGDGRSINHVKEACDWFHSLVYPDYGNSSSSNGGLTSYLLTPPHKLLITIANFKTMICIPNSVNVEPGEMWDTQTGLPFEASVTLSLTEIGIQSLGTGIPPGVADIRPLVPISTIIGGQ
jgi:hypothetical protein